MPTAEGGGATAEPGARRRSRGWAARECAPEVADLVLAARDLLGWDGAPRPEELVEVAPACVALDELISRASEVFASRRDSALDRDGVTDIVDILSRAAAQRQELQRAQLARYTTSLGAVAEALRSLESVTSTRELAVTATEAACVFGFDRVLVSWIDDAVWVGGGMTIKNDPDWASEVMDSIEQNPVFLDQVLEYDMIRSRVPLLVADTQTNPRANRVIADRTWSRSYVGAPIAVSGRVVGMIHGDCYFQRRAVDELDRQLMATFAEGIGYAVQRTVMLDELNRFGESIANISRGVPPASGRSVAGPVVSASTAAAAEVTNPRISRLTAREDEIAALISDGLTNQDISDLLYIAPTTVKTHVKHVLRKLGASSRAAAVAILLRERHHRGPVETPPRDDRGTPLV